MSNYDYTEGYVLNPDYKNILELDKKLTDAKIPHELLRFLDGWSICYPDSSEDRRKSDVVIHKYSYGHGQDLMEAYQFDECNGDVLPCVTVESAFVLFKNAYERDKKGE